MRRAGAQILKALGFSIRRCREERAPEAAGSMAFYTIFSLFPLLLILVAASSFILESVKAQEQILETILKFFPAVSHQMIRQNVLHILQARGAFGIVGAIGLLWAASGVFTTLVHNLNRAWLDAPEQNIFKTRLIALVIVACLAGLLPVFFLVKAVVDLISGLNLPWAGDAYISLLAKTLSNLTIYFFIFIIFMFLYRWVPNTKVRWPEAFAGAFVAAVAAGAATFAFSWYLRSGLSRYTVVYGSLGVLLSFMSWVYVMSLIILCGAHVSAAIAHYTRAGPYSHHIEGRRQLV